MKILGLLYKPFQALILLFIGITKIVIDGIADTLTSNWVDNSSFDTYGESDTAELGRVKNYRTGKFDAGHDPAGMYDDM